MIFMKSLIRYVALCILSVYAAHYGVAQTAASDSATVFAPLSQWKNAVLSGDRAGLKALYSTTPPAKVTVPPKDSSPDADVDFWAGLKALI
jgi:hypothetical protein